MRPLKKIQKIIHKIANSSITGSHKATNLPSEKNNYIDQVSEEEINIFIEKMLVDYFKIPQNKIQYDSLFIEDLGLNKDDHELIIVNLQRYFSCMIPEELHKIARTINITAPLVKKCIETDQLSAARNKKGK